MQNLVLPLLPPSSSSINQTSQRKATTFFIHKCGWKVPCYTSSLIVVDKRTSTQYRLLSDSPCQQRRTRNPTPLDGSSKEVTYTSTNNVACHTISSYSKMRYCVIFPLSKFVMLFWAIHIYGNTMLYMILGLVVLLLLRTRNCTWYRRQSHLVKFPWSLPRKAGRSSLRWGIFSSSWFTLRMSEIS